MCPAFYIISFLHQNQDCKRRNTSSMVSLFTLPIPGHREAFLVFFFSLLEGSLPTVFFPQFFMRALPHEKCGAVFQESYSLVAFQYGQRNLAISNYSSEVVSFSECQHSLAPVEGIKILSPIVTMECFLQTVILHRRL